MRRRTIVTIGSFLAVLVVAGSSGAVVSRSSDPIATVGTPTTRVGAAPTMASPSAGAPLASSGSPTSASDSTHSTATGPASHTDPASHSDPTTTGAAPTTAPTTPDNPVPPAAPSNVFGTLDTATRTITFHWTDNADNEDAYTVTIWIGSGDPGGGSWLSANATSYTWTQKVIGQIYCADVTAHNFYGVASAPRTCLNLWNMVPAQPSNLTATAIGPTTIRVGWSDNSNNEDGFVFLRGYIEVVAPANSVSINVTGLEPATEYCFLELRAYNAYGTSQVPPVPNVCATTLAA